MSKAKRKILLFFTVLLCTVFCVLGFIFATSERTAQAYVLPPIDLGGGGDDPVVDPGEDSEQLYFEPGAAIRTDGSFSLKFTLHAKSAAFSAGKIKIYYSSEDYEGVKVNGIEPTGSNSFLFNLRQADFTFDGTLGTAYVYATTARFDQNVQLSAVGTGDLVAISSERSVKYIYNAGYAANDPDMIAMSSYIAPMLTTSNEFKIDAFFISLNRFDGALTMNVNMSQAQMTQIRNGVESVGYRNTRFGYADGERTVIRSKTVLQIVRSTTLDNRGNVSLTSAETVFEFSGNVCPIGCSISYGDSLIVSVPLPDDPSDEYYYYARIYHLSEQYQEKCTVTSNWHRVGDVQRTQEIIASSTNYKHESIADVATEMMGALDLSDVQLSQIQALAGLESSQEQTEITVAFKTFEGGKIVDDSFSFFVNSVYAQSPAVIYSELVNRYPDYTNISAFNVVSRNFYVVPNEYECETENRIVLTADRLSYTFAGGAGTVSVLYKEFDYKDVRLVVQNNDPDNNLALDFYTANAVDDGSTITITFTYSEIAEQLKNSAGWLVDFSNAAITIENDLQTVDVEEDDDGIVITCAKSRVGDLAYITLSAVVDIVEDVDYNVSIEYKALTRVGAEIRATDCTTSRQALRYSETLTLQTFSNFMSLYGATINDAVDLECLDNDDELKFYVPNSVVAQFDHDNKRVKYIVGYAHNIVISITNNQNDDVKFIVVGSAIRRVMGDEIIDQAAVPNGFRVLKIEAPEGGANIANSDDVSEIVVDITISQAAGHVIPLSVVYTDFWATTFNYFVPYRDNRVRNGIASAVFFEKKSKTVNLSVATLGNIYDYEMDEFESWTSTKKNAFKSLLGDNDFTFDFYGGQSVVNTIEIEFDGVANYTVDVNYSLMTMRTHDYNGGNARELHVPLTSYADWCEMYGVDWSIQYLNRPDRIYFLNTNEIARENLYGFFTVAVFAERVSDLNYYFQRDDGNGAISVYRSKEVSGSKIYQWFESLDGTLWTFSGHVGMSFCELFNRNDKIYYSYFIYLDGTTVLPSYNLNGADDSDSALKNRVQDISGDVGKWIKGVWEEIKSPLGKMGTVVATLIAVIAIVSVVALCIVIIRWATKKRD